MGTRNLAWIAWLVLLQSAFKNATRLSNINFLTSCCYFSPGQYVFIETSTPQKPFDKARLLRYGSGEACMTFFYHMYGSDIGSLIVYQNIHGVDIQLWRKDKNLGKQWWKAEVQLKVASSYQVGCCLFVAISCLLPNYPANNGLTCINSITFLY